MDENMKRLKDMESLPFEELERIAEDKSIETPEGLTERMEAAFAGLALEEQWREDRTAGRGRKIGGWSFAVACAIAVAVVIVGSLRRNATPVDTFDDPLLAYAQLERSLRLIAEGLSVGSSKTTEAMDVMGRSKEIIDNILSSKLKTEQSETENESEEL